MFRRVDQRAWLGVNGPACHGKGHAVCWDARRFQRMVPMPMPRKAPALTPCQFKRFNAPGLYAKRVAGLHLSVRGTQESL